MFTERFIRIPVAVVDNKQKEMFGEEKADKFNVTARLNPFEIVLYREDITDEDGLIVTIIQLKDGSEVMAAMGVDEFEKILNK